MPITTLGTVKHVTPTVLATFFKHYYEQAKKEKGDRHLEATDEFLYDEAFHIVKRFISQATNDEVEALQKFTATRIPAPPRTTVVPALIPLSSCDRAAKAIIDYFGPEDIKQVVGGEKWWQVRGLNGVEAEWVAMTSDWKKAKIVEELPDGEARVKAAKYAKYHRRHEREQLKNKIKKGKAKGKKLYGAPSPSEPSEEDGFVDEEDSKHARSEETISVEELDRLRRCICAFHGGGFYFGSAGTTHRYQFVRMARKMGGRVFACNYRKAPGYPWPAPLQDCLAAYFYLIDPPPEAKHKAIDPKNIILAGDSAGGGMCLAVLSVLRDLGLPMPAGAVLISPWSDLTHSFPSILQNTETDIIPPYGFIHKPSTLWPVPSSMEDSNETSRPVQTGVAGARNGTSGTTATADKSGQVGTSRSELVEPPRGSGASTPRGNGSSRAEGARTAIPAAPTPLQSKDVKVDMSDGTQVHLKQQIQLYATNDQLYHPLCSPVLQGSLGGLPPLYIIAGDAEVLRDEVIMLAHRAARPEKYPLPDHLLAKNARARDTAARFNHIPTKVHLQVYDYQCHVLTLFTFTTAARVALRAIASFAKYVTNAQTNLVASPFPELREEPSVGSSVFSGQPDDGFVAEPDQMADGEAKKKSANKPGSVERAQPADQLTASPSHLTPKSSSEPLPKTNVGNGAPKPLAPTAPHQNRAGSGRDAQSQLAASSGSLEAKIDSSASSTKSKASRRAEEKQRRETLMAEKRNKVKLGMSNEYSGQVPLKRPDFHEHMIRERVDVRGSVRPLEEETALQGVRFFLDHPERVGTIMEGPVKRYLEGQSIWDHRYQNTAKKVEKKRRKNEEACEEILRIAAQKGLLAAGAGKGQSRPKKVGAEGVDGAAAAHAAADQDDADWVDEARYGPLDVALAEETPPPSALAGRRDCDDAVTLLRLSLHLSAREVGIKASGKRNRVREEILGQPPKVPVAEASTQPKRQRGMHGMSLWTKWMGVFGKRTRKKAFFEDLGGSVDEMEAKERQRGETAAAGTERSTTSQAVSG